MRVASLCGVVALLTSCASVLQPGGLERSTAAPVEPSGATEPAFRDTAMGTSSGALRIGTLHTKGDLSALDPGIWGEVAFDRRVLDVLSLETSFGYFDVTGEPHREVFGIPLLIGARLQVPVGMFEPYVGGRVGGLWATALASGADTQESWATMFDLCIGVDVRLSGFALGAEYRYVRSDDLDDVNKVGHYQLEGNVFLLTGRLLF